MKKNQTQQLVVTKDDYDVIVSCLKETRLKSAFDRKNVEELQAELKKARVVAKEEFPEDVVRINSRVKIKEENKDSVMEVMLVTPEKADIKEKKISIMAPVAAALIGFRKGQKVKWQVPAGTKTFLILDVDNL
jgi:regulator of nucleoside diphosphate kinase